MALSSNEVQEIISYKPHWIIRNGNVLFFFVLVVLFAFTWFIQYPDIIKGSMKLVAINAPKSVVAKTEGKLEKLLVSNQEEVQQGQALAFLQSAASPQQVMGLQKWVAAMEPSVIKDSFDILLSHPLPVFDQLGDLQSDYQGFQSVCNETMQVLANGYYQQKQGALVADMDYLSAIQKNTKQQQQILKQDYELQQREYHANEMLTNEKVIAPIELGQNKSKLLNKEQGLQQMKAQVINNNMNKHNKQKEILDVKKYIGDQQQKFRAGLLGLKSKIEIWKQQYVISAPESGQALFTSFLQENQLVYAGQELFYVQPQQSIYYGELKVAQSGLGKIKAGQKVLARLQSYPSTEFGYITGAIGYISAIPTARDSFLIKVDFPKGLTTNYNKTIFFRNGLVAGAEVMTDDRRLFDRFVGQLKDIIRR
ncbi:MAG: HlyD family efflux transporter periplasmic adaptor subunit [Bacteroidetes bacterium]|nr:HlyD family efflux transporter periplasmic adaptor subunit [Bacteroidota bacterium]